MYSKACQQLKQKQPFDGKSPDRKITSRRGAFSDSNWCLSVVANSTKVDSNFYIKADVYAKQLNWVGNLWNHKATVVYEIGHGYLKLRQHRSTSEIKTGSDKVTLGLMVS